MLADFIAFCKLHGAKDAQKAVEFFAIFSGFDAFETLDINASLEEQISQQILKRHTYLQQSIDALLNIEQEYGEVLTSLASGDRAIFKAYKKSAIDSEVFSLVVDRLLSLGIVSKEYSREKTKPRNPKQKRKKYLRRYKPLHKIIFNREFLRFWFTFIAPNEALIAQKEYAKVLEIINQGLEKYVSLTFEYLCVSFVRHHFNLSDESTASYWDRVVEIDILSMVDDEVFLIGEVKWKNHKVCKNICNGLQLKASRLGFTPRYIVCFSKSGFSKELRAQEEFLLFDLSDFAKLIGIAPKLKSYRW